MHFEYNVLNYNFNKKKVESFNIFNNIHVQNRTEREVKKYLRSPKNYKYTSFFANGEDIYGFPGFVKELEGIIMGEEWGRSEYEMSCGYAFETDCNKLEKFDCYDQCKPNMEMIAREVIYQYKQAVKKNDV